MSSTLNILEKLQVRIAYKIVWSNPLDWYYYITNLDLFFRELISIISIHNNYINKLHL